MWQVSAETTQKLACNRVQLATWLQFILMNLTSSLKLYLKLLLLFQCRWFKAIVIAICEYALDYSSIQGAGAS